jgi:Ni/Co efflux regulator RcnB
MRKIILATLMAATFLPSTAFAQNGELRRDRQDVRDQQRDVQRARQSGDRDDVRRERGQLRDARQELREDRRDVRQDRREWRRDDWRSYRNTNRGLYSRGNWNADFRYRSFTPGIRITSGYYAPRYYINDYGRYRLPTPGFNQRWVRHYNDVLLVDVRGGRVIQVLRNFYL